MSNEDSPVEGVKTHWWVDGHYANAVTAEEARRIVAERYDHLAEIVRPWTDDDDEEVPQGKPDGERLSAERKTKPCPACRGVGSYPSEYFDKPEADGSRPVKTKQVVCAACNGTGRTQELQ